MSDRAVPWWRELTKYQWLVLVVAWLGWVFDIMDTALFNLVKAPMLKEVLGGDEAYKLLGPAIEGRIQMVFILGWAIGGLVFGILADRWGRTRTLVATILIYCFLTGLTAFCQTWEQVAAVRFLTAIGIGGEWAAGAALIAEVVPNRARAGAAALLQTAAAIGPVLAALANQALKDESWRWMFVVGVAPALVTVLIRAKVKEPQVWIDQQAGRSTDWLQPLKEMFAISKWRRHALVAMVVGLVGIAGAGTVAFWSPNLVKEASEGLSDAVVRDRTSVITYLGHAGTFLGVLFFPWLCDRIGRRTALFSFFAATPIALYFALNAGTTYEALMWKAPILFFFAIGLSAGFGLYFPELFPTRFRATGAGFAYNVARIGQAPLPLVTGMIMSSGHSATYGVMVSGCIYFVGLLALPFAPETKGKPLPDNE